MVKSFSVNAFLIVSLLALGEMCALIGGCKSLYPNPAPALKTEIIWGEAKDETIWQKAHDEIMLKESFVVMTRTRFLAGRAISR